jgi:hypothetical protein
MLMAEQQFDYSVVPLSYFIMINFQRKLMVTTTA